MAKFFLIKAAQVYGESQDIFDSVVVLSERLGMTDKAIAECTKLLIASGYMRRNAVSRQGVGRPKNSYSFLPKLWELVEQQLFYGQVMHQDLIDCLLAIEGFRGKLKTPGKLFLATLLAHADECGVVRGIGTAGLMKLTGMSKDRIGYQIDTLMRNGYIRARVPGITSSHLFGRAEQLIFLNLKHSDYSVVARCGVTVLAHYVQEKNGTVFNEKLGLKRKSSHSSVFGHVYDEQALVHFNERTGLNITNKLIADYVLMVLKNPEIGVYFQMKLHDWASYLLSNYWRDLNIDPFPKLIDLKARLSSELFPNSIVKKLSSRGLTDIFIDIVSEIVLSIAKRIQNILVRAVTFPLDSMKVVLLPCSPKNALGGSITFYAVEMLSCVGKNWGCVVLSDYYCPDILAQCCVESDLSHEEKYRYGLLTLPKRLT